MYDCGALLGEKSIDFLDSWGESGGVVLGCVLGRKRKNRKGENKLVEWFLFLGLAKNWERAPERVLELRVYETKKF